MSEDPFAGYPPRARAAWTWARMIAGPATQGASQLDTALVETAVVQALMAGFAACEVDGAFARAVADEVARTMATEPGTSATGMRQAAERSVGAIRTMAERFEANPDAEAPDTGSG